MTHICLHGVHPLLCELFLHLHRVQSLAQLQSQVTLLVQHFPKQTGYPFVNKRKRNKKKNLMTNRY